MRGLVDFFRKKRLAALLICTVFFSVLLTLASTAGSNGRAPMRAEVTFADKPAAGIEPIVVTGVTNAADFLMVNYLDPSHFRLGYDSWFHGGPFSASLPYQPGKAYILEIDMPSLHADAPSPAGRLLVKVDGKTAIDETVHAYPAEDRITVGSNTAGGNVCSAKFSGQIQFTRIKQFSASIFSNTFRSQLGRVSMLGILAVSFLLSVFAVAAVQKDGVGRREVFALAGRALLPGGGAPAAAAPRRAWGRLRAAVFLAASSAFALASMNRLRTLLPPNNDTIDLTIYAQAIGAQALPALDGLLAKGSRFSCVNNEWWPACDYLRLRTYPYFCVTVPKDKQPDLPVLVFIGDSKAKESPEAQVAKIEHYRVYRRLTPQAFLLTRI
jgi:hypothetical protein